MVGSLWDVLFGCSHRRTTFPITPRWRNGVPGRAADMRSETYIVCLECGKQFPYSWEQMRVLASRKRLRKEPAAAHGLAAWLSRHRWSSRGT